MKKVIMSLLAAAAMSAPALADPIKEDEFFTPHAQGCMLLQECTDHVQELKTVSDLNKHEELADSDYSVIADEFNSLIRSLNTCLLYTSPSPRDQRGSRMPSSA